jgi:hypothetical protein
MQQILSALLIIGCVLVMIGSFSGDEPNAGAGAFATLGILIGLIWFIMVRFMAWWHHG